MNTHSSQTGAPVSARVSFLPSELAFCNDLATKPVEVLPPAHQWYHTFFALPEPSALQQVGRYRQLLLRAGITISAWTYATSSIALAVVTYAAALPFGNFVALALAVAVCHGLLLRAPRWCAARNARAVVEHLPALAHDLAALLQAGQSVPDAFSQVLAQSAPAAVAAAFSRHTGADWLPVGLAELQLRYPHPEVRHFCTIGALIQEAHSSSHEHNGVAVAAVADFLQWYRTHIKTFQQRAQRQRMVLLSLCAVGVAAVLAAGGLHGAAVWQQVLLVLLLCVGSMVISVTSAAAVEGYDTHSV